MANKKIALDRLSLMQGALWGMYIGDALAMPVHWYSDREALHRDYGLVSSFLPPRNPHPDSEMWKHFSDAIDLSETVLHDQATYWNRKDVHYHQFLTAGENTLNIKLCNLLIQSLADRGKYDADDYLCRLITFITTPRSHHDTYVDSYLRGFFRNYNKGIPPRECGVQEIHLSGLFGTVPLLVFYSDHPEKARATALEHISLTHRGEMMLDAAELFITLLQSAFFGIDIGKKLLALNRERRNRFLNQPLTDWLELDDTHVADTRIGMSCSADQALPLVLYLFLKYAREPKKALIANTNLGGNNAARGAVLGALLGSSNGFERWPTDWRSKLKNPPDCQLLLSR